MNLGQINETTALGKALMSLIIQDTSIITVLDVGCWNGLGSTLCVLKAAEIRKKAVECIAIEANKKLWAEAVNTWKFKAFPEVLRIVYGRISKTMMSRKEIESHPLFPKIQTHYKINYEQDVNDFEAAPLLQIPKQMDLVILDGGEFCGKADLDAALLTFPRYIVLDDVEVMKNCENAIRLGKMGWEMIWYSRDRNGSVIFRKKKT